MYLLKTKENLYEELETRSPRERRELILSEMDFLSKKDIHCFNCSGTCCTMSANSMKITPLEAFEIILSLDINEKNVREIKSKLKQNILDYRLDHEISLGKKAHSHLRKTYTCPFFVPGSKGCTIKKELKPYGCLGFNPKIENDNGSQCHSDISLLEKRENAELSSEEKANNYLRKELNLTWDKLEIPKAVLILLENFFDD